MGELYHLLDFSSASRQTIEHSVKVSTRLHRNNAKLVFFIYPHEECLLFVMEDSTAIRPVQIKATSLQEPITFFEQEVVSNQLATLRLR